MGFSMNIWSLHQGFPRTLDRSDPGPCDAGSKNINYFCLTAQTNMGPETLFPALQTRSLTRVCIFEQSSQDHKEVPGSNHSSPLQIREGRDSRRCVKRFTVPLHRKAPKIAYGLLRHNIGNLPNGTCSACPRPKPRARVLAFPSFVFHYSFHTTIGIVPRTNGRNS
jgi:hypothetical protein